MARKYEHDDDDERSCSDEHVLAPSEISAYSGTAEFVQHAGDNERALLTGIIAN